MPTKYTGNTKTNREPVAAGETVRMMVDADKATLAIAPEAGGSVLVEFTISAGEHIDAGEGIWHPAEGLGAGGVVSQKLMDTIPSTITAVRFTAQGAAAVVEVAQ